MLAAILSPFVGALILVIHGRSPEKKAEQLLLTETALANKRMELENKRAELALRG
jgi:protein tyrosine/serine phosphatase